MEQVRADIKSPKVRPSRAVYTLASIAVALGAFGAVQNWPSLGQMSLYVASNILGNIAAEAADNPSPKPSTNVGAGLALAVGDQLKVTFYEMLDVPDDRSGYSSGGDLKTFYQRMDLSGDYSVQQDGTVSLPRLGTFSMAGRELQDVQQDLAATFEREMGHSASVSIVVADRAPIYIVGPVRNPGSFKYVPGMIVLQAVALAGGVDNRYENAPQVIDGIREIERFHKTHERLQRLMARRARLVAERDNEHLLVPPERLLALVDAERARQLIEEETNLRNAAAEARQTKSDGLDAAAANARNELKALQDRLAQFAEQIEMRNERLKNLKVLSDSGAVVRKDVMTMRSDIADIGGHRQEVLVSIAQAEQKVAEAERAKSTVEADYRTALNDEILKTDQEIEEAHRTLVASGSITGVMGKMVKDPSPDAPDRVYEIVRRSVTGGTDVLPALDTSDLQPGDVLRIEMKKPPAARATANIGQ